MFTDFLYLLRAYGLPVGLVEWTALMDGLRLGLEKESLMEFYHMARAILVKRETDYDRFDQAFAAYFKGLADHADLSEEMERWLSHALTLSDPDFEAARLLWENKSLEEIREIMSQRIKEQKRSTMAAVNGSARAALRPLAIRAMPLKASVSGASAAESMP